MGTETVTQTVTQAVTVTRLMSGRYHLVSTTGVEIVVHADQLSTAMGFLLPATATAGTPVAAPTPLPELREIATAYLRASGGRRCVRVRLTDLRREIKWADRAALDAALIDLACQGKLALYGLDDPLEVQPEDRADAIRTATGMERHIVYMN